jgi:hypothetical protein
MARISLELPNSEIFSVKGSDLFWSQQPEEEAEQKVSMPNMASNKSKITHCVSCCKNHPTFGATTAVQHSAPVTIGTGTEGYRR